MDVSKLYIITLMYLGLLSDVFDGIIARGLGIASTKLRRLDSQVDLVFWLSIGFVAYSAASDIIREYKYYIIVLFFTEFLCYAISFIRFGRETCTHAYLSKFWGLTLLIAFTSIIGFHYGGIPLVIALVTGYLAHLDRILITLILPYWTHDIPSTYHAYLIRKGKPFRKYKLFN
jgi:CDP-diacylglycerol--glycerol-3-phosphate 3-phosphatidyltransferase